MKEHLMRNNVMEEEIIRAGLVDAPNSAAEATRQTILGIRPRAKRGPHPNGKEKKPPRWRSLAPIAEFLDCEGFTEYLAQRILNWCRSQLGEGWATAYDTKKAAMGAAMKGLTDEQKMAIGKFIAIQHEMGFQAGLRLGLMSYVTLNETDSSEVPEPEVRA